jgi:hypothetical protein
LGSCTQSDDQERERPQFSHPSRRRFHRMTLAPMSLHKLRRAVSRVSRFYFACHAFCSTLRVYQVWHGPEYFCHLTY